MLDNKVDIENDVSVVLNGKSNVEIWNESISTHDNVRI